MRNGTWTRTWIFVVGLAAAGCGGDDGDVDAWLGNWNTTGTQSTTCTIGGTSTSQLTGVVVITAGAEGGTISTLVSNCPLVWDVDGSSATLRSGQMCTISVGGGNVTVTWTQSTATLSGDTITANNTGSTNNGCSFMQQATLTRM